MKDILKNAVLALVFAAGLPGLAVAGSGSPSTESEVSQEIPSMLIVRVKVDSTTDTESEPVLIPVNYDKDVVDEATAQEAIDAATLQGMEEISLENQNQTAEVPQEVTEIEDAFSKALYEDSVETQIPNTEELLPRNRMAPWVRHGRFAGHGRSRGVWWGIGGGRNFGWYGARTLPIRTWLSMGRGFRVPARYGFAVNRRIVPFFHTPFTSRRGLNRYFFYSRPF